MINFNNNNYNCLRLIITAWLHPVNENATPVSKYVNNFIVPHQTHENDFAYTIIIQKIHILIIWLYNPCDNSEKQNYLNQAMILIKIKKMLEYLSGVINIQNTVL